MYKNIWKNTKFICSHRHSPAEMTIHDGANGASPFYSCPHYYAENRAPKEDRACPMRLNFVDAEGILDKFSSIVNNDISNDIIKNYANYEFDYKAIHVKVMKFTDKELIMDIFNKKALR